MPCRYTLLALAAFASVTPPSTAQDFKLSKSDAEVKVDAEPGIDFGVYKTYGWSESQEPAPNPVNHIRITRAIERELQAKGLKPSASEPPDLRIHYFGYIEKKLKGTSHQEETYRPTADVKTVVDFSRVKEGTLILELFARTTGRLLWRGVATEPVAPADETEAQISRMVKALVQRYPPKS
jgi:Domain of unknown function (DUF4136)